MYHKAKNIVQKLTRGAAYAGMALLIPMMLLTSADVVSSSLWTGPISGSMEISGFMLSVFVLLGIAYTQQVGDHVRVTVLIERLPKKLAEIVKILTTGLMLFIVLIVMWQGWVHAFEAQDVSDMLRIPSLPFRLLVSGAALLLALELLFELTDSVCFLLKCYKIPS